MSAERNELNEIVWHGLQLQCESNDKGEKEGGRYGGRG